MSGERGRAYKADRSFRVDLGVRRLGFRARMTFFIGMLLWFEAVLLDSLRRSSMLESPGFSQGKWPMNRSSSSSPSASSSLDEFPGHLDKGTAFIP